MPKKPKEILYSEPASYFPKALRDQFFQDAKKETPKKKTLKKAAKK